MRVLPPPLFSSKARDSLPTSTCSICALPQGLLAVVSFISGVGVTPMPAMQLCEGQGGLEVLSWGHVVSRPGLEGAGPWSHPASVCSFTSWLGFLGWWVHPASHNAISLSPLFSFAKLLQSNACAKIDSFSPFSSKRWQLAVQAANHTLCHAFTGLGASAAAVAGVKSQV